ncbi:hypothetical protein EV175_000713 [Coemansia sp. RSA 1933]|nr:hypothetical protein EV175_000713 [Coemansia sp. RSA 1933]
MFRKKAKEAEQDVAPEYQQPAASEANEGFQPLGGIYNKSRTSDRKDVILKFQKRPLSLNVMESRLKRALVECRVTADAADWKATRITQLDVKRRVIKEAIRQLRIPIHSRALNNIKTVGDLLEEFIQKPVQRDAGHPVAIFFKKNADELPENMKFESYGRHKRKLHVDQ